MGEAKPVDPVPAGKTTETVKEVTQTEKVPDQVTTPTK